MMMRSIVKSSLLMTGLSLFLGLLCAAPSYAQPVPGDREIQISGGFFRAQGADAGTATADVSYGYFFRNPAWQIGLRQGLSYAFIDNASDQWTATSIPFINYHLYGLSKDNRVVPFLGAFIGAIWNDNDATGTLGPNIGAKFFLDDRTFLTIRYRYEWFFEDVGFGGISDDAADGNHVVTIGLGFLWGGK